MPDQAESYQHRPGGDLKNSPCSAGAAGHMSHFSPITTVIAASVLTIVLLLGLGWQVRQSYLDHKRTQEQNFPIQALMHKIIHYDEVLTMSANMAAATGDLQWETRYRRFEPQLDVAIKSLEQLVPETFDSAAAMQTDKANVKLVEMENSVFELVAQKRLNEAQAVLAGDDYGEQKRLYSNGMQRIAADLENHTAIALASYRRRALIAVTSVLLGLLLLVLIWLWVLRNMRRYLDERHQAEGALRESEERFRSLVGNIPGAVYRCETAYPWAVEHVSEAFFEITGFHAEDLAERKIRGIGVLIVAEDVEDIKRLVAESIATRRPFDLKYRIRHADGGVHWVHETGRPVYDRDDKPLWLDGVMLDITKSKQAEHERRLAEQERERLLKALEAKNEELQSIVYVASHDLKSPLVNIQGFSGELATACEQIEAVLHGEKTPVEIQRQLATVLNEDIPESIKFIRAGTLKMEALLKGLLQVSRVGTAALKIEALDMNEMMERIIASMQFQITESGADMTVDDLPGCIADNDLVNQVFSNLLANAVNYLDPHRKGLIHVSGRVEGADSIYSVQDNGLGIAHEHQPKVFELFHRLEPTGAVKGEGLGLTIARRILDRQRGKIWLKSQPKKGSSFFVSLPRRLSRKEQ